MKREPKITIKHFLNKNSKGHSLVKDSEVRFNVYVSVIYKRTNTKFRSRKCSDSFSEDEFSKDLANPDSLLNAAIREEKRIIEFVLEKTISKDNKNFDISGLSSCIDEVLYRSIFDVLHQIIIREFRQELNKSEFVHLSYFLNKIDFDNVLLSQISLSFKGFTENVKMSDDWTNYINTFKENASKRMVAFRDELSNSNITLFEVLSHEEDVIVLNKAKTDDLRQIKEEIFRIFANMVDKLSKEEYVTIGRRVGQQPETAKLKEKVKEKLLE